MQKRVNQYLMTFRLSLCLISIGTLFIVLIPVADFNGSHAEKVLAYGIGLVFWLFTIMGYILFYLSVRRKKALIERLKTVKRTRSKVGAVCFFSTFEGSITDGIMIFSAILFATNLLFIKDTSWFAMITVTLLMFSVQMHCILNGENFKYSKFIQSRRVRNAYKNED